MKILNVISFPWALVLTKTDKGDNTIILRNILSCIGIINKKSAGDMINSYPFLVSSVTGEGIDLLKTFIYFSMVKNDIVITSES